MAKSAFIVRVPEAEPCVGALRERFDPSARLGVPAHVTVLFPFMAPDLVTDAVLERARHAICQVHAFSFKLTNVRRFSETTYLAPDPAEPFIALTESLYRSFPQHPPFGGDHEGIVPHLTVAHGSRSGAEIAAVELAAALDAHGPVASICRSVVLLEDSSGCWKEMHAFALPTAADAR